jgi:UTP:GlnB (protein PII) uridylyltransferase
MDFLHDLETTRHNRPQTRNARLVAIKSFMRFVEYRAPAFLEQSRRIQAIPAKRTETRLISGSQSLFDEFVGKIGRVIFRTSPKRFIQETVNERCKEYHDYYSATACLLEPNVKKSPGGLRDIQLLRWVGLIRYGTGSIQSLQEQGLLSARDLEDIAPQQEAQ